MADKKETKYGNKEALKKFREELFKKQKQPRPLSKETIEILNEYEEDLVQDPTDQDKQAALPRD